MNSNTFSTSPTYVHSYSLNTHHTYMYMYMYYFKKTKVLTQSGTKSHLLMMMTMCLWLAFFLIWFSICALLVPGTATHTSQIQWLNSIFKIRTMYVCMYHSSHRQSVGWRHCSPAPYTTPTIFAYSDLISDTGRSVTIIFIQFVACCTIRCTVQTI